METFLWEVEWLFHIGFQGFGQESTHFTKQPLIKYLFTCLEFQRLWKFAKTKGSY